MLLRTLDDIVVLCATFFFSFYFFTSIVCFRLKFLNYLLVDGKSITEMKQLTKNGHYCFKQT